MRIVGVYDRLNAVPPAILFAVWFRNVNRTSLVEILERIENHAIEIRIGANGVALVVRIRECCISAKLNVTGKRASDASVTIIFHTQRSGPVPKW